MKTTRVKFVTDKDGIFEPDRLGGTRGGTREDFAKLGIEVLGEEAKDSGWDFEGVDVRIPDKEFDVYLSFDEDDKHDDGYWSGDLSFVDSDVGFGYIEKSDFEIISGYNPFKGGINGNS